MDACEYLFGELQCFQIHADYHLNQQIPSFFMLIEGGTYIFTA